MGFLEVAVAMIAGESLGFVHASGQATDPELTFTRLMKYKCDGSPSINRSAEAAGKGR